MKRGNFYLGALLVLVIFMFPAVFVSGAGSKEKMTIHVAMVSESREAALKSLESDFEQKTGIKADIELIGNMDMKPKMLAAMQSKSSDYDIVQFDYGLLGFCAESGWLYDLTDLVKRDSKEVQPEDFHPVLLKTHIMYKDRWYGMPLHVNNGAFFYRKDIFKEMGFGEPKNWDDVISDAKAINQKYAPNTYGIAFMGAPDVFPGIIFHGLLISQGGDLYDRGTFKPMANTPAGERAMNILLELKKYAPPGVSAYSLDQVYQSFAQGTAAMAFAFTNGWWFFNDPKNSKVVGKVEEMSNPGGGSIIGGWFLGVSQFSQHKEAAWKWLKWATSADMERRLLGNMECPRLSILKDPEVQKKWPNDRVYYETLENSPTAMPQSKSFVEIYLKVATIVNEVLIGTLDPKKALQQIDTELRDIFIKDGNLSKG